MKTILGKIAAILAISILLVSCAGTSAVPPTETPTATPSQTATQTATFTPSATSTYTPTFTPTSTPYRIDKNQILYTSFNQALVLLDLQGYKRQVLDGGISTGSKNLFWGVSPDGQKVLYARSNYEKGVILDIDTSAKVELPFPPYMYAWSPDGSRLLMRFSNPSEGGDNPWRVVLLDTKTGEVITEIENDYFWDFAFLPDNRLIASDFDALYIHNPILDDNGFVQGFVDSMSKTFRPEIGNRSIDFIEVSPDGRKVAFIGTDRQYPYANADIYILDLTTGQVVNLTNGNITQNKTRSLMDEISWSPDSTRVAFWSYHYTEISEGWGTLDRGQVFVADLEGNNLIEITGGQFPNGMSPSWSPDGSKIVFVDEKSRKIIICNADGSEKFAVPGVFSVDNVVYRPSVVIPSAPEISPAESPSPLSLVSTFTPTPMPAPQTQLAAQKVYFSVGSTLYSMDRDGSNLKTVANLPGGSEQIFVDSRNQKIYLSSWSGSITILDLTTNSQRTVSAPSGDGGQGIAFDPDASRLFAGLYYSGVYAGDAQKTWTQIVTSSSLSPLLGQRGQLQIDPANRHIYFRTAFNGNCGECRYIYRVDYDGNNLQKVTRANGGDCLALDLQNRQMYFSNTPGDGTLWRANLDGTNAQRLFTLPSPYTFCRAIALDLAEQKMYLSLYDQPPETKRAIARINLDGSGYEVLYETGNVSSGGIGLLLSPSTTIPAETSTPIFVPSSTRTPTQKPSILPSPTRTSTQKPLILPSPTKTATFTRTTVQCNTKWTRIVPGPGVIVLSHDKLGNTLRSEPKTSASILQWIARGSIVEAIEGPVCDKQYLFWKVKYGNVTGWVAETDGTEYYLSTNQLLLTNKSEVTSEIELKNGYYIFKIYADRILPAPTQLQGGGRIDFIWFIDADTNRNTGQFSLGNDYNIHLYVDGTAWGVSIFPVSPVALQDEINRNLDKVSYKVEGNYAEISFPASILPNSTFRWWLRVTGDNSTSTWQQKFRYPIELPEMIFP